MEERPSKCIYCETEGPLIEEDWLSRGFGRFRGIERLKGKICKVCNEEFGKHETVLFRSSDAAFYRAVEGIGGRHDGRDPLIGFKRPTLGVPPIRRTIKVDGIDFEIPVMHKFASWDAEPTWVIVWRDVDGIEITTRPCPSCCGKCPDVVSGTFSPA